MEQPPEFKLDWLAKGEEGIEGKCYELVPKGTKLAARVGHACAYDKKDKKVYFIGGAVPSGAFDEVWVLDLASVQCELLSTTGFQAVYEHSAFLTGERILVFGGADMGGNNNTLQELDIEQKSWKVVEDVGGEKPLPRTLHCGGVKDSGAEFIVFGGGEKGSEPIEDTKVHVFKVDKNEWDVKEASGTPPSPRHGHIVVVIGDKIFLHGGMCGTGFYDDLYILEELPSPEWKRVEMGDEECPCARAAHGAVALEKKIYIFGGLGEEEALNDLWMLDTESMKWSKIDLEGPLVPPRLDFAMVLIELPWGKPEAQLTDQMENLQIGDGQNSSSQGNKKFILVHGGMNTFGDIFDDFYVLPILGLSLNLVAEDLLAIYEPPVVGG